MLLGDIEIGAGTARDNEDAGDSKSNEGEATEKALFRQRSCYIPWSVSMGEDALSW